MIRKKPPIGISDFANLINENYYFVDKSLLIKEILDSGAKVTLLSRPRRFGKTVNMSMVKYFFEKTDQSNRELFKDLQIANHPECMAKQGQYPVIFLTFKDVKDMSWVSCQTAIKKIIAEEFTRHANLLKSEKLTSFEAKKFVEVSEMAADDIFYIAALKDLSAYLHRVYGSRPIILIDEYDAPIHAAAEHNYYNDVINFMRGFLSGGLKDNSSLEFCILTGILRIAKESIFSGLNNLEVNTYMQDAYADKFGLLESEVSDMLAYFGVLAGMAEVRTWYNGYQSGPYKIYNPWSIINFTKTRNFEPYWINTSDNALLKTILQQGPVSIKEKLELIIQGKSVACEVDENVVMTDILTNERVAWSLLLMSGYLTFENYRREGRKRFVDLKIPNEEIAEIYDAKILSWFEGDKITQQYTSMLRSLVDGKVDDFQENFGDFALQTLSFFDVKSENPENFYHGLVLGMLASLRDSHEVISNRESGLGRYDVSIFPRDIKKPGIIIEFKVVNRRRGETLESCAKAALQQIEDRQYEAAMRARGITTIIKFGISFEGKENLVLVG